MPCPTRVGGPEACATGAIPDLLGDGVIAALEQGGKSALSTGRDVLMCHRMVNE
jgi:hypothetical protein